MDDGALVNTLNKDRTDNYQLFLAEPLHVLLVEDNVVALHFIETIMKQAGLKFTSALDGESALELVKSNKFDLIITDIGLPGISGYQLADAIRQWEKSMHQNPLPIIGLTALSRCDANIESVETSINKMLFKPINLNTVQELIRQCMYPN